MRILVLLFAVMILALGSVARADDVYIDDTGYEFGCRSWVLCNAQEAAGTCISSGPLNNILKAGNEYTWSAWADTSTSVEAWTVKLYDVTRGSGYQTTRTLINASGDITPSNFKFSWNGISGDIHAIIGGTLTSGNVTVVIKGCPLVR